MKKHPPFIEKLHNKITTIETAKVEKEINALQKQIEAMQASLEKRIAASMHVQLGKLVEMGALDEDEADEIAKDYGIAPAKKPAPAPARDVDPCARGGGGYGGGCR
jgi:replicative superfamily II helicase